MSKFEGTWTNEINFRPPSRAQRSYSWWQIVCCIPGKIFGMYIFGCCFNISYLQNVFFVKEVRLVYLGGLQSIFFCQFFQLWSNLDLHQSFNHTNSNSEIFEKLNGNNFEVPLKCTFCKNELFLVDQKCLTVPAHYCNVYFEYFVIHFATSIPNVLTAKKLMKKNQTYCII